MEFKLDLKKNKKYVLESVKHNGLNLEHVSEELKEDKDVVVEAVKENGLSLKYASFELRNDKKVVLEAVKHHGLSLLYASLELRSDKDVVLEAVKENGFSLQYASSELKNDEDVLRYRKIMKMENDIFKFGKCESENLEVGSSYNGNFDDLIFHLHLGRGVCGSTYLCNEEKEFRKNYVVKIYNNLFTEDEKKEEILSRDCLYIPHQKNVVPILKHWTSKKIDLFKLPDYERYWKKKVRGKRYIPNCGSILMNYYETTLNKYLESRMKKNDRLLTIEIIRMFWGLLCGVCHLHEFMIVHRDLHGDNIFVIPRSGRILVGDFGCCLDLRKNKTGFKVHKDHELMFSFTNDTNFKKEENGEIIGFRKGGVLKMIPPEIKNFNPLIDEFLDYSKSDIYSVGILGFILLDHLEKEIDNFGLREFITKLVTEDPEKRLGCLEAMEIGNIIFEENEIPLGFNDENKNNFEETKDKTIQNTVNNNSIKKQERKRDYSFWPKTPEIPIEMTFSDKVFYLEEFFLDSNNTEKLKEKPKENFQGKDDLFSFN